MRDTGNFRDRVYEVVKQIPRGKVASYGLVALLAGRIGAARAVGAAMREVPVGLKLPYHRVIKSDGTLAPRIVFKGKQRGMLEKERVVFGKGGRVDMGRCEWEGPVRRKGRGWVVAQDV
jgi:methylated-DNA-protein-cysteine methyltransferase related protein